MSIAKTGRGIILPSFQTYSEFGGETALHSLIENVQSLGYSITAHDNHMDGYHISEDKFEDILIRTQDGNPIKDGVWGGGQSYRLCSEAMLKKYSMRNLNDISKLGFKGLHFIDVLSTTGLNVCWDPNHPNNKTSMMHWRVEILKAAKQIFGGAQSEGPFDFACGVLDRVLYIESGEKELMKRDYVDSTVPLYEMTYHGILMYNTTYDSINALPGTHCYLKNLAYGGMPYFYFYRHFATKNYVPGTNKPIAGRHANEDFVLDYLEDEVASIKRATEDYIEELGHLQTCWMTEYTQLTPTLSRTDYSNGQSLFVNIADVPAVVDTIVVAAKSFVLK